MKKTLITIVLAFATVFAFAQEKKVTKTAHVQFYSHTALEDITSSNYKVTSALTPSTGVFVFSVPMQSFELSPSVRQKHFNSSKFLDTKQFPKAKFKGQIVDLAVVDFTKDGVYPVSVTGNLEIHGVKNTVTEKGTVTVKNGSISVKSIFPITLGDYAIFFTKGKPSKNIAKTVEVTIEATY